MLLDKTFITGCPLAGAIMQGQRPRVVGQVENRLSNPRISKISSIPCTCNRETNELCRRCKIFGSNMKLE